MTVREAVEISEILRGTSRLVKAKIESCGIIRKYTKGELVFRDRDEVNQFYFVVSGYVAMHKINKNQDRKVIFIHGKGEMLNEVIIEDSIASINCEALGNVEILSIYRKTFMEMMAEDSELNKMVINSLSKKARRLYHQLANTSNMMHLERQAASKLWKLGKDYGIDMEDGVQIDFDMSITFFADMLGSKRESVSRIIKKFTERGLVRVERGTFIILDMDGLIEIVSS